MKFWKIKYVLKIKAVSEFWESVYKGNKKMWGANPTDNAYTALEILLQHNCSSILIPGFGYGRNARVFYEKGFGVTEIEVSKTAIKIARNHFGPEVTIHHGSVSEVVVMPKSIPKKLYLPLVGFRFQNVESSVFLARCAGLVYKNPIAR